MTFPASSGFPSARLYFSQRHSRRWNGFPVLFGEADQVTSDV